MKTFLSKAHPLASEHHPWEKRWISNVLDFPNLPSQILHIAFQLKKEPECLASMMKVKSHFIIFAWWLSSYLAKFSALQPFFFHSFIQ